MSGHTPAPWHVSQRPHTKGPPSTDPADAHLDYFHIEAGRAEEDGGWEIAGYMRPADARLIAAAPDLLTLAKKYARECGDCSGHRMVPDGKGGDEQCTECTDIWAVIDKAEGR